MLFQNRRDAGKKLTSALAHYTGVVDVVVLALPRGGVPVAYEVALAIGTPLNVFLVRKLGVPGHEELAMGAIASGGVRVLNEDVVQSLAISEAALDAATAREEQELVRREHLYCTAPLQIEGKIVILVDDGLATGSTMRAALTALRQMAPARVVVAVPVAASTTCDEFRREADEVVCIATPEPFSAVGYWYENFDATSDEEINALLHHAHSRYVR